LVNTTGPIADAAFGPTANGDKSMLYWALVFLVIAVIAGILGFGGIASTAASIAQVLFFIFLVVFVLALIMGMVARRPGPPV
jgi:uncharacterized membrane protein YtjA (UPF0391 family)